MADNDNSTNSNEKPPREKRESADKYNPGNQAGKGPVHKEDAEQHEGNLDETGLSHKPSR